MIIAKEDFIENISGHSRTYLRTLDTGEIRFGKKTTVSGSGIDWDKIYKEIFALLVYKWIGLIDAKPGIFCVDGLPSVERINVPFSWQKKLDNPELKILEEEASFCRLLISDIVLKHENRARGKNEHIGLVPMDDVYNIFPIDNENSLENLVENIEQDWINQFFSSDFPKNSELIKLHSESARELPLLRIGHETINIILSCGYFSNTRAEELLKYNNNKVLELQERLPRAVEAVIIWADAKQQSANQEEISQGAPIQA